MVAIHGNRTASSLNMSHVRVEDATDDQLVRAGSNLDCTSWTNWALHSEVADDTHEAVNEMTPSVNEALQTTVEMSQQVTSSSPPLNVASTPASGHLPPVRPATPGMSPYNLPATGFRGPSLALSGAIRPLGQFQPNPSPPAPGQESFATPPSLCIQPNNTNPPMLSRNTFAVDPASPKTPLAPSDSPIDTTLATPTASSTVTACPSSGSGNSSFELELHKACIPLPSPSWETLGLAVTSGGAGRNPESLLADITTMLVAETRILVASLYPPGQTSCVGRPFSRRGPTSHELVSAVLQVPRPDKAIVNLISGYGLPPQPKPVQPAWLQGYLRDPLGGSMEQRFVILKAEAGRQVESTAAYVDALRKLLLGHLGRPLTSEEIEVVTRRRTAEVSRARMKAAAPAIEIVFRMALFPTRGQGQVTSDNAPAYNPGPTVDGWQRLGHFLSNGGASTDACKLLLDELLVHEARFVPTEAGYSGPRTPPQQNALQLLAAAVSAQRPNALAKFVKLLPLPVPELPRALPARVRGCLAVMLRDGEGGHALQEQFKLVLEEVDAAAIRRGLVVLGLRQCLLEMFGGGLSENQKKAVRRCHSSEASRVRDKVRATLTLLFLNAALTLPSSTSN